MLHLLFVLAVFVIALALVPAAIGTVFYFASGIPASSRPVALKPGRLPKSTRQAIAIALFPVALILLVMIIGAIVDVVWR